MQWPVTETFRALLETFFFYSILYAKIFYQRNTLCNILHLGLHVKSYCMSKVSKVSQFYIAVQPMALTNHKP